MSPSVGEPLISNVQELFLPAFSASLQSTPSCPILSDLTLHCIFGNRKSICLSVFRVIFLISEDVEKIANKQEINLTAPSKSLNWASLVVQW